jgi:hypothetical protein
MQKSSRYFYQPPAANFKLLLLTILAAASCGLLADSISAQNPAVSGFKTQKNQKSQKQHDDRAKLLAKKQDDKDPAASDRKPKVVVEKKPVVAISAKRKAELMKFVKANHAELERLINSLRKKRPSQYQSALRSLDRSVKNLNAIKANQSEARYKQALADWKLKSRIQLLSAQLSITDNAAKRKQLKQLLVQQLDNRRAQLKADADRAEKRLARINEALAKIEADPDAEIARQMGAVVRNANRIKTLRKEKASVESRKNQQGKKQPDSQGKKTKNESDKDGQ